MRAMVVLVASVLTASVAVAQPRMDHDSSAQGKPAPAAATASGDLDPQTREAIEGAVADARKALRRLKDLREARCETVKERADLAAEQIDTKLERILLALERRADRRPTLVQPVTVTESVEASEEMGPPYMAAADVDRLSQAVAAESFAEDQLRVLRLGLTGQPVQASDAKGLLARFNFAEDKLKALQVIAPFLYDRQNAYQLLDAFTFSDDREAAQRILSR